MAVVAFADQISKSAVVAVLGDGGWSSGPLRLAVVRNPGGPFGLGAGASMFWTVVTATVVIGAVAVIASARCSTLRSRWVRWSAAVSATSSTASLVSQAPGAAQ